MYLRNYILSFCYTSMRIDPKQSIIMLRMIKIKKKNSTERATLNYSQDTNTYKGRKLKIKVKKQD